MSIMKTNTSVLSMCLKNYSPKPLFLCASYTIPGISAIVIWKLSTKGINPIVGFKVVN